MIHPAADTVRRRGPGACGFRSMIVAVLAGMAVVAGCGGTEGASPVDTSPVDTPTAPPNATGSSDIPSGTSMPADSSSAPSSTPCDEAGFSEATNADQTMPAEAARLAEVRVGRHDCFERTVLQFAGSALPQYEVQASAPPFVDPSGQAVAVRGNSFLRVGLTTANAHTEAGAATVSRTPVLPEGFVALQQVQLIEDFEAMVVMVIGLDQRRPFRVLVLTEPTRLVIDVFTGAD